MMSEVFEGYERQYCELSANLSRKCSSTSLVSDQEQKLQKFSEIKAGLDDADVLIRKMDLEARSLQPSVKAMLLAKLREYKSGLSNLKKEFKRLTSPNSDEAAREELLEAGMADTHSDSHHMEDSARREKVRKYEEFVDKRLKPDLIHAISQRPDTQRIFVDVGFGFHVEFTWSEALNYIEKREEKIARQIDEYTRLIASIKAQIKLVCEGIRELLQLPAEKFLPERIF
ncbi:vesicle transport v-SNARE 12-like isoform X2 [Vigna unguiculata]|uniref:vesicle transport v-SNARE 12-like isoform X2 n=1 Tax=Vigna unguiculata TaxID=3917 RepID=UPI001016039D|nr:vesicle transport v-SNARE 12-like isoform X2 [Vigna unguiculata]